MVQRTPILETPKFETPKFETPTLEIEGEQTDDDYFLSNQALSGFVPEELYWEVYYSVSDVKNDVKYEWNNGQLEEVPVTDYAKYVMYLWFLDVLRDFLHVNPIARVIGLDFGFRLALPAKTTIRKPDLGVVLHTNPAPLRDYDRSYRGIFDLCIESLSDSGQREITRDTVTKRDEYAAAGVKEYYILDERRLETEFYQLTQRGFYEPMARPDGVIRSSVLPGFQFRIQDLYDQPDPSYLIQDSIYRAYISPRVRAERQRAEQERWRAEQAETQLEQERRRNEQERWRAERAETQLAQERRRNEQLASLLRSAGILPPD